MVEEERRVEMVEDKRVGLVEEKKSGGEEEMRRLEGVLREKEADISSLRLDLASAQSELEQVQRGKPKQQENGREEQRLEAELEKQRNKVVELETRLGKLQQEAECTVHNEKAARVALEGKLKAQEKELKTELAEASNLAGKLGRQVEEQEKKLVQVGWFLLLLSSFT